MSLVRPNSARMRRAKPQRNLRVEERFAAQKRQALHIRLAQIGHDSFLQLGRVGNPVVEVLDNLIVAAFAGEQAAAQIDAAAHALAVDKANGL